MKWPTSLPEIRIPYRTQRVLLRLICSVVVIQSFSFFNPFPEMVWRMTIWGPVYSFKDMWGGVQWGLIVLAILYIGGHFVLKLHHRLYLEEQQDTED